MLFYAKNISRRESKLTKMGENYKYSLISHKNNSSVYLSRVTVSAISFEGTECHLMEVSRVIQATGGEVSVF